MMFYFLTLKFHFSVAYAKVVIQNMYKYFDIKMNNVKLFMQVKN